MIWWVFFLAILAILSYMSDLGFFSFLQNLKAPFLNASLLSVLILLSAAGLLSRMLWMKRKGQKESQRKRILELEEKVATLEKGEIRK